MSTQPKSFADRRFIEDYVLAQEKTLDALRKKVN